MYPDLQRFVAALDAAGELARIREPADPVLEIPALADLASKSPAPTAPSESAQRVDPAHAHLGGPALLFERPVGSSTPVLINAFGSYRRMEMALGCHDEGRRPGGFETIADRIGELVKPQPPRSLGEAVVKARQVAPLVKIGPRRVSGSGASQEVVLTGDRIDLTTLPITRCWPADGDFASLGYPAGVNEGVPSLGHPHIAPDAWDARFRGRYITLSGIHTVHASERDERRPASHNIGMYRVQLLGKNRLAMHWHMHHDGAHHWRSWKAIGRDMPVAIALGGPSVLPYAATAPLPPGVSELLMAGFLNGTGMRLVRGKTVPIWVPADAEIIIEGTVSHEAGFPGFDPRDGSEPLGPGGVFEGPFGDHTGFYSLPDRYPVMRVTAVTHRRRAIFPTTVVGLPPQEDYFLGKATERLFLPLLKVLIPDIIDYDLPMFGAFHNCAVVKIRKQYPMHARRVMHAIWGAGQMAWTKSIIVVDDSVDVHDAGAVRRAISEQCHPTRDIERVYGALDILDHAAPHLAAGRKIGFDATPAWEGEQTHGVSIADRVPPADAGWMDGVRQIDGVLDAREIDGWGLVRADRGFNEPARAGLGRRVCEAIAHAEEPSPPFVIVVGRDVNVDDIDDTMFHWLANSDPGRDAVWSPGGRTLVFDATPKTPEDSGDAGPVRPWPPILAMPEDVRDAAARRWAEIESSMR